MSSVDNLMEGGIGQWERSRSTLPLQPQQTTQKSRAHNRPFCVQLRSQHIHACICRLLPCASIFTMYCGSLSACPMEINAGSSPLHSLVKFAQPLLYDYQALCQRQCIQHWSSLLCSIHLSQYTLYSLPSLSSIHLSHTAENHY